MRILINDSSKPEQSRLEESIYDESIHKYICEQAVGLRKILKINSFKVSSDKNIKILE